MECDLLNPFRKIFSSACCLSSHRLRPVYYVVCASMWGVFVDNCVWCFGAGLIDLCTLLVGRHCATIQKVRGAIPNEDIGIFHWLNPFGRTMAMCLTKPLTTMSTIHITRWCKGSRLVRLTTLPLYLPIVLKFGSLNLLEFAGPFQVCTGIAFALHSLSRRDSLFPTNDVIDRTPSNADTTQYSSCHIFNYI
jgi:hypothetical protein